MQNLQYYTQEHLWQVNIHYKSSILIFIVKKVRPRKAYVGPVK